MSHTIKVIKIVIYLIISCGDEAIDLFMKDEDIKSIQNKLCSSDAPETLDNFKRIIKIATGNCEQRRQQIEKVNKQITQFVLSQKFDIRAHLKKMNVDKKCRRNCIFDIQFTL